LTCDISKPGSASQDTGRGGTLDVAGVQGMIGDAIENVDLEAAKEEVRRFLVDPRAIDVLSKEFFRDVAERLRIA